MALLMLAHTPASRAVSAHRKLRPPPLWPPTRPLPPGRGPSLGPSRRVPSPSCMARFAGPPPPSPSRDTSEAFTLNSDAIDEHTFVAEESDELSISAGDRVLIFTDTAGTPRRTLTFMAWGTLTSMWGSLTLTPTLTLPVQASRRDG